MGSSSSPKVQVSEYRMSLHLGFCHAVDYLLEIFVKEKSIWSGSSTGNQSISVVKPSLFGGVKKEGGLVGTIEVMHGRSDQVAGDLLAGKLGTTSAQAPGFRDYLSLFFHGGSKGFLWSANYPYLHPVWAKVSRTSSGWYPEKSSIGDGVTSKPEDYVVAGSTSLTDGLLNWPIIRKVVGDRVHVSFSEVAPSSVIGSTAMPTIPLYSSEVRVYDATTGAIVDTYLSTCAHYRPPTGSWFTQQGSDTAEAWHFVSTFGNKNLWWYANHFNDGGSPASRFLCLSYAGFTPDAAKDYILDDYMDFSTDAVSGVFLDTTNEIALVVISRHSTKQSRWIEIGYDETVYRTGNCDFYASVAGITPPTGVTVYSLPLGYCQWPTNAYSGCYDYPNWTAISVNSGGHVDIYQVNPSGVLSRVKRMLDVFDATTARTAVFPKNGVLQIAVRQYPNVETPALLVKLETSVKSTVVGPQMNPAHIIREVLTNNDWGLGIDEDLIDDVSFTAAADTLYAEGFGLSLQWAGQSTAEDFINDILSHIDGTYGTDPATGKFYIKLIRGDYDVASLDELTDDEITITSFTRNSLSDTSNEVVVTWTNPENEEEQTVTVHDIANYSAQGVIISTSRNYHAVRTSNLALRCAMRELSKVSQPIATFEVEANRLALDYKSGDVIKVTYPEYGLSGLPCRVMSINRGKPGEMAVKMTLMEDVFDMPAGAYVVSPGTEWEDTPSDDLPINVYRVESAPYYLVAKEIGDSSASSTEYPESYTMILATGPGAEYGVYTQQVDTLGNNVYSIDGSREYAGTGILATAVGKEVTSTLSVSGITEDPVAGMLFYLGDELCVVESYDSNTGNIVARRGMLDTVPVDHAAGERLWFFTSDKDIADPNVHTVGQMVKYKLVPEGQSSNDAIIVSATMSDRMYRPYRPASVKVNGSFWPEVIVGNISVSWVHRNRLFETAMLSKWNDASVTEEAGTTYTLRFYDAADTLFHTVSGLTGLSYTLVSTQGIVRVEVEAVRDGYASYQRYNHSFERAGYGFNYGNYYGGL